MGICFQLATLNDFRSILSYSHRAKGKIGIAVASREQSAEMAQIQRG
jgi:hypothetical protein